MMQPKNLHDIDAFANALQLSIQSTIRSVNPTSRNELAIYLEQQLPNDRGWKYFCRIAPGRWDDAAGAYLIANDVMSPSLTSFLLLTRLQPQQMQKLAELDPQYIPFVTALKLAPTAKSHTINTIQDAVRAVFQRIEQQHMTLREVAEKSGLTQVSISNFKAGNDIKLSSLLKIAKVVGVKVRLD